MNIRHVLGKNLRKYRSAAGFSQESFAEHCGMHRTYIGGIEQEKINVSIKNLGRIAKALGIPPFLLLANSDEFSPNDLSFADFDIEEDTHEECIYATCTITKDEVVLHPMSKRDQRRLFKDKKEQS